MRFWRLGGEFRSQFRDEFKLAGSMRNFALHGAKVDRGINEKGRSGRFRIAQCEINEFSHPMMRNLAVAIILQRATSDFRITQCQPLTIFALPNAKMLKTRFPSLFKLFQDFCKISYIFGIFMSCNSYPNGMRL